MQNNALNHFLFYVQKKKLPENSILSEFNFNSKSFTPFLLPTLRLSDFLWNIHGNSIMKPYTVPLKQMPILMVATFYMRKLYKGNTEFYKASSWLIDWIHLIYRKHIVRSGHTKYMVFSMQYLTARYEYTFSHSNTFRIYMRANKKTTFKKVPNSNRLTQQEFI